MIMMAAMDHQANISDRLEAAQPDARISTSVVNQDRQ